MSKNKNPRDRGRKNNEFYVGRNQRANEKLEKLVKTTQSSENSQTSELTSNFQDLMPTDEEIETAELIHKSLKESLDEQVERIHGLESNKPGETPPFNSASRPDQEEIYLGLSFRSFSPGEFHLPKIDPSFLKLCKPFPGLKDFNDPFSVSIYDSLEEYHDDFSLDGKRALESDEIPPKTANAYHPRYRKNTSDGKSSIITLISSSEDRGSDASVVRRLYHEGIMPHVANDYPFDLNTDGVIALFSEGIRSDIANEYPSHLRRIRFERVQKEGTTGKIYLGISPWTFGLSDGSSIIELYRNGIMPEDLAGISVTWNPSEIIEIFGKCTKEEARKRLRRDKEKEIKILRKYSRTFSDESIELMRQEGMTFTDANPYTARFNGEEALALWKSHIDAKEALKFSERFGALEIIAMKQHGVTYKRAKHFSERFSGHCISVMYRCRVNHKVAEDYPLRFNGEAICILQRKLRPNPENIPPVPHDIAAEYPDYFSAGEIVELVDAGIDKDTAISHGKRSASKIIGLIKGGIESDISIHFDTRYDVRGIKYFLSRGADHTIANEYPERFGQKDAILLHHNGVGPIEAATYDPFFNPTQIIILNQIQIKGEETSTRDQERRSFFKKLVLLKEVRSDPRSLRKIGSGSKGIVFWKGGNALKFSEDVTQEYELLRRVQEYHIGLQRHVVRLRRELVNKYLIEMDYIEGYPLADLLEGNRRLPPEKVWRYGLHILQGVLECRQAGVFHRDLHDLNIMIEKDSDEAVIIDLGSATTDPNKEHPLNRQYGGNNDLISVGQICYRMATGSNLFKWEPGQTRLYKEEVKQKRMDAYRLGNRRVLKGFFQCILDELTQNQPLARGIVTMLDDDLMAQPDLGKVESMIEYFRQYQPHQEDPLWHNQPDY